MNSWQAIKRAWSVLGEGGGHCLFVFCLLVLLGRHLCDEKSQPFTKLTLSKVAVRLADATVFMLSEFYHGRFWSSGEQDRKSCIPELLIKL